MIEHGVTSRSRVHVCGSAVFGVCPGSGRAPRAGLSPVGVGHTWGWSAGTVVAAALYPEAHRGHPAVAPWPCHR
eukprot:15310742-Alexandrium_andersonii.AAC.3